MTATTNDLVTPYRVGNVRSFPVAAAAVVYAGAMVVLNTSGYALTGTDDSTVRMIGIAQETVDNTDGAAGDLSVRVRAGAEFLLTADYSVTQASVSDIVYLVDNATFGKLTSVNGVFVGWVTEYVSSSQAWVYIPGWMEAPDAARVDKAYTVKVAGVNATAFDLAASAATYGGADFYVTGVLAVQAFLAADQSPLGLKVVTTHYTVSGGVISAVGNETANNWLITFLGRLV